MGRIPILLNHRQDVNPIGWLDDEFVLVLPDGLTREQIFDIVGGAGLQVLEQEIRSVPETGEYKTLITRARILELSLCPQPARAG